MIFSLKKLTLLIIFIIGSMVTKTMPDPTKSSDAYRRAVEGLVMQWRISGKNMHGDWGLRNFHERSFVYAMQAPGFPEGSDYGVVAAYLSQRYPDARPS
ncbi:hypothetical protein JW872_02685 [Candidatus Babeliales bacterium]|nr:hypothetical protein [Candidatus Babeliales bacterium]